MKSVTIRNCRREDLDRVFGLEQICFPGSPVLPFVALVQYFDLFKKTFVVAETAGKIVGFAIVGSCSLEPESTWLLDVAVDADFRKNGIAAMMLNDLRMRLRKAKVRSIKATVSIKNSASRRMLEKVGFKAVEEVDEYFGKGEPRLIVQEVLV